MRRPEWRPMTWIVVLWIAGMACCVSLAGLAYELLPGSCSSGCRRLAGTLAKATVEYVILVGGFVLVCLVLAWFVTGWRAKHWRRGPDSAGNS